MTRCARLALMTMALGVLTVSLAAAPSVRRDAAKAYTTTGPQPLSPQQLKDGKPTPANQPGTDSRQQGWKVPALDGSKSHSEAPPRDKDRPRDNPPRSDADQSGNPLRDHPGRDRDDADHGSRPDRPPFYRPGHGYNPTYHRFPNYWARPGYYDYYGYYYSSPYDWVFPRYWDYPRTRTDSDDWRDYDPATPPAPQLLGRIVGAEIWAADGVFLGIVDPDPKADDSICNPEGPYGNFASPTSILNPRGEYGAGRGPLSCWDPDTRTPPRLFWHGRFVGYLTANPSLYPRTDPAWILDRWLSDRR